MKVQPLVSSPLPTAHLRAPASWEGSRFPPVSFGGVQTTALIAEVLQWQELCGDKIQKRGF